MNLATKAGTSSPVTSGKRFESIRSEALSGLVLVGKGAKTLNHVPIKDPSIKARTEYGEMAHPFRCTRCSKTALPGQQVRVFVREACVPRRSSTIGSRLRRFSGYRDMRRGDVRLGSIRIRRWQRMVVDISCGVVAGLAFIAAIGPMF